MAETLTKGGLEAVAGKIFTQMKMFKKAKEFYQTRDGGEFSYASPTTEPNREMKKLLIEEAKWKETNSEYK